MGFVKNELDGQNRRVSELETLNLNRKDENR